MERIRWAGKIARRKLKNGKQVGPYLIVRSAKGSHVVCDVIGHNSSCMLLKENVHICRMGQVVISDQKLEFLKSGRDICAMHPACKTWINVLNLEPELIRFHTLKGYEAIFVVEYVKKRYFRRAEYVAIVVNEKIIEKLV